MSIKFFSKQFVLKSLSSLSLALLCFGVLPSSAHEEHQPKPSISITGTAERFATPDVGELILGIQVDDKLAANAQVKASAVLTAFTAQLKGIGINANEIKTIQNSLNPVYDYSGKPPNKITSYQAVQQIQVKITGEDRLNLLSKTIDLATKNSINTINSIHFGMSASRLKEFQKELYAEASKNALETAKSIISSLGLRYVGVTSINANYSGQMNNYVHYEMMAKSSAPAGDVTSLSPGESRIQSTVNLAVEFAN
jgi:uncharacterized protein